MGEEHDRGEQAAADSDGALSPSLDQSRMQAQRRAATDRLLARLKALDGTHAAQTPRAYAQRYVRQQEALILGLLNAWVGTEEILTDLAPALSSIPTAEFRHAIAQLRDRQRKQIGASPATAPARPAAAQPPGASDQAPSGPTASTPSAPDRRADESDEDYRLRKALEGPPDQSRQFIGEH
ncbi:MAG: hypothetical protein WBE92_06230 [Steroidobacteraceae bacterium]